MTHGTITGYQRGCRCDPCRKAWSEDKRARRAIARETRLADSDHERLSLLLNDLFPLGLTDDCPARQRQYAA